MKTTLFTMIALIAMFGLVAAGSCGSSSAHKHEATPAKAEVEGHQQLDIVETAMAADNFTTLVAAVKAAGLVDALKGEGPFTVFAPTDEAFAELPEATLKALLADPEKLASILTYHVVEGAVSSDKVVKLDAAQTLNGRSVAISTGKDKVMINDAEVIATDIVCSNGIIHVIDRVILPTMEAK